MILFRLVEIIRGCLMPYPFWLKRVGKRGEYLARRHFHRRGYHLVAKNWIHGKGELDLIMANERLLLVIEVKTRLKDHRKTIDQVLRYDQEQRLLSLAKHFVRNQAQKPIPWRFVLFQIKLRPLGGYTITQAVIR